jgi:hypothetical protein
VVDFRKLNDVTNGDKFPHTGHFWSAWRPGKFYFHDGGIYKPLAANQRIPEGYSLRRRHEPRFDQFLLRYSLPTGPDDS